MGFYRFFGMSDPVDADHRFVTSNVFWPGLLGGIRLAIGIFQVAVLVTLLVYTDIISGNAGSLFSYFTILSYIGLCAYFFAAAVQTIVYARTGKEPLNKWPRVLQLCHLGLASTILVFPFIVSVEFWALLAAYGSPFGSSFDTFSSVSIHVLNLVFCLFEIVFSRLAPSPWSHLIIIILCLALYLGLAYITLFSQKWLVYPFLNPTSGWIVAAYVFGTAIGAVIVFAIVHGLVQLRCYVCERKPGRQGKRSAREVTAVDVPAIEKV